MAMLWKRVSRDSDGFTVAVTSPSPQDIHLKGDSTLKWLFSIGLRFQTPQNTVIS